MDRVIGIGNPWRRDDGAGIAVARRLRAHLPPEVRIVECDGDAARLIELWRGAERVVVVDALVSKPGAPPGTLRRIDALSTDIPQDITASSHGVGLSIALGLAKALGTLPSKLIVYGIEGNDFTHGETPSPAVENGIGEAVRRIADAWRRDVL